DVILHIIPYLGIIDRTNFAAACKRFYSLEARAEESYHDDWQNLENAFGIKLWNHGNSKYCAMRTCLDSLPSIHIFRVLRRIQKTHLMKNFEIEANLHEPKNMELLKFIFSLGAEVLSINHQQSKPPAKINLKIFESISCHCLYMLNVALVPKEMERFYEIMKASNTKCSLRVSVKNADDFLRIVMGINQPLFRRPLFFRNSSYNHKITTSRSNGEVYLSGVFLALVDGQYTAQIYMINENEARIELHHSTNTLNLHRKIRIPYASTVN
ncbi:hypothetical protein PMAYCL1PPCAC_03362, partial [Pristionchus mayeri]